MKTTQRATRRQQMSASIDIGLLIVHAIVVCCILGFLPYTFAVGFLQHLLK